MIRPATPADAEAIARIYNHYIEETIVTFEEVPIDATEIARRMGEHPKGFPWYVAEVDGQVTGYAYAGPWRMRAAFRHTMETSVYLDHTHLGQGTGTSLYRQLIETATQRGLHVLIGGVSLPNPVSVALHEKLGFEKVAHFKEVGRKFDRWIDVGFWQLELPASAHA